MKKPGKAWIQASKEEIQKSKLDLVVAGTKDAVLMVESEASGLSEKIMLDAVKFGHEKFVPVVEAIEKLAYMANVEMPKGNTNKRDTSKTLLDTNQLVNEQFSKNLANDTNAKTYLSKRNINQNMIDDDLFWVK